MKDNFIFIPGNVPSSKNSRRNFGHTSLPSKATVRWRKNAAIFFKIHKKDFKRLIAGKDKPYTVKFQFVRGTKHKFDYINPAQTIQDEMVHYGWIEDDNCDIIIPEFIPYFYDKKFPGVYISVD